MTIRPRFANTSIAVLLAFGLSSAALAQEAQSEASETETADRIEAQIADRVLGDENAAVVIDEYANFTCSHCADFHKEVFPQLKADYIDTGKVKFVYHDVITNVQGVLASSLARCVPENQFFGMAKTLYENQAAWAFDQTELAGVKAELGKYAAIAGLDEDALNTCFDDREMQEALLAKMQEDVTKARVQGTPTLVINGEQAESWAWESLSEDIEAALAEAE